MLKWNFSEWVKKNLLDVKSEVTTHLAENANKAHGGFQGALITTTNTQSIPDNTETKLIFTNTQYDTKDFFDSESPTGLTIPAGIEKVIIKCQSGFAAGATGRASLTLRINDASPTPSVTVRADNANFFYFAVISPVLSVDEGDFIEFNIRHASGGAKDTLASVTHISLEVVE